MLLIWAVGAVCALAGAFCYSELGVNFPSSGGEYVYLTQAFGPDLGIHDRLGFLLRRLLRAHRRRGAGISPITSAISIRRSSWRARGDIWRLRRAGSSSSDRRRLLACCLIAAFTILNCLGVRRTAQVQNVLTSMQAAGDSGIPGAGLRVRQTEAGATFAQPAVRTSTTPACPQFFVSLLFMMFGYSGWNAATYVAEELKRRRARCPWRWRAGTALVAALYLGLNVIFIYSDAAGIDEGRGRRRRARRHATCSVPAWPDSSRA